MIRDFPDGPTRDEYQIVVRAENIHKSYGSAENEKPVLRGIDLEIRRGECVFLIGPSGSGKTTLLSIIGCVLTPDSGSLTFLGRPVAPRDHVRLRRNRIGFVFQGFRLIRGLTALENVCVPMMINRETPEIAQRRAWDLLRKVGMDGFGDRMINHLSAGQCQRVALARALANEPSLVLADEPTAALDSTSGEQAMRLLHQVIHEGGKSAIVVTHDPRILSYADRVYELENGLVREGVKLSLHRRRQAA